MRSFIFEFIIKMQKHSPTSEAALGLLGLKKSSPRSSPIKIRVNATVGTIKNRDAAGKLGKFLGKTGNNMYILEVEGKQYNFFKKDLEISTAAAAVVGPKKISTSPKKLTPGSSAAERIASNFINQLDVSIADKVISAICKRRTSRVKNSPPKTGKPKSPAKRKSPKRKTCKENEELSRTGRCIQKCKPDQYRDSTTNRCRKRTSKKTSPSVVHLPESSTISGDDDNLVTNFSDFYKKTTPYKSPVFVDYEQYEPRIRLTRPSPTYATNEDTYQDPISELIAEEDDGANHDVVSSDDDIEDIDLLA